jgi:replication-associated recombination protein RarA
MGKFINVKPVKPPEMPQTSRGYDIYELASALQKDVRRGNEYQAMFWAAELESFNSKMLWNRLQVIASEDIGVANPFAPLLIDVLERKYDDAKKRNNDSCRLFLVHAVLFLARSHKSRIVDDFLNVVYGQIQHEDKKLAIPDYALDMHTLAGKKRGRGLEHFFSEGNKLGNEALENPYTEKAKEMLIKHGGLKSEFKRKSKVAQDNQSIQEYFVTEEVLQNGVQ